MDYKTNYDADYNTKENVILTFKDCPYEYVLTGELGRGSSYMMDIMSTTLVSGDRLGSGKCSIKPRKKDDIYDVLLT